MKLFVFPDGFLWGAATAAHQVEGGNRNDWSEWEHDGHARDRSGRACDHWRLPQFREDIDVLRRLRLNAYRFSIEWSRVMPSPNTFDAGAAAKYRDMALLCRDNGISVTATLHHFTNPLWFTAMGGWESAPVAPFVDYAEATVMMLGDVVDRWIILNEPMAVAIMGWVIGNWPPGASRRYVRAYEVLKRLALANNRAYARMREHTDAPIGIAHSMIAYEPGTPRLRDRMLARLADRIGNQWFLRRAKTDFIGVNYYMRERWRIARLLPPRFERVEPDGVLSDYGWEVHPQGLYDVLMSLKRYRKPVYVTENGIADAVDSRRSGFIRDHVVQMHRAIGDGADVRGYFHWSLLDNFEWDQGYAQKFGLLEVDRSTGRRVIRPSAWEYAEIARTNAIVI